MVGWTASQDRFVQTLRLGKASEGGCDSMFSEQLIGCHAEV
jgi:hypothetical protein